MCLTTFTLFLPSQCIHSAYSDFTALQTHFSFLTLITTSYLIKHGCLQD